MRNDKDTHIKSLDGRKERGRDVCRQHERKDPSLPEADTKMTVIGHELVMITVLQQGIVVYIKLVILFNLKHNPVYQQSHISKHNLDDSSRRRRKENQIR